MFLLAAAAPLQRTLPEEPTQNPSCNSALLAILFLNLLRWAGGVLKPVFVCSKQCNGQCWCTICTELAGNKWSSKHRCHFTLLKIFWFAVSPSEIIPVSAEELPDVTKPAVKGMPVCTCLVVLYALWACKASHTFCRPNTGKETLLVYVTWCFSPPTLARQETSPVLRVSASLKQSFG